MTKDMHRQNLMREIGHGGFRCSCCNSYRRNKQGSGRAKSRNRRTLGRMTRARMKADLIKIRKAV